MIAADSSVIIALLQQERCREAEQLHDVLRSERLRIPPTVITELHGTRKSDHPLWRVFVEEIAQLSLMQGYWQRAGEMRRTLLQKGFKAKLGDTLIAQSCIDHDIPLLTRDKDFRHFEAVGLRLVLAVEAH